MANRGSHYTNYRDAPQACKQRCCNVITRHIQAYMYDPLVIDRRRRRHLEDEIKWAGGNVAIWILGMILRLLGGMAKLIVVESTIAKKAITRGKPGLPWVFFHVESIIDYFVGFSQLSKNSKPRLYPGFWKPRVYPGLPWVVICDHFNGGFHHMVH